MKGTNFDRYLARQLRHPDFAGRFKRAGVAWDVALQIAALREQAGLSQKELGALLKTSQQQVSRLESPGYEGHSLSTLRRIARALNARVRVIFEPDSKASNKALKPRAARVVRVGPRAVWDSPGASAMLDEIEETIRRGRRERDRRAAGM